jgi:hypothetical protein
MNIVGGTAEPRSFSELTVDQRLRILNEVSKRLRFTAVASRAMNTEHWKAMTDLGERIGQDQRELANDFRQDTSDLVFEAIQLIADFQEDVNISGTLH